MRPPPLFFSNHNFGCSSYRPPFFLDFAVPANEVDPSMSSQRELPRHPCFSGEGAPGHVWGVVRIRQDVSCSTPCHVRVYAVLPTPATHAVLAQFKAGETVYQAGELPKTLTTNNLKQGVRPFATIFPPSMENGDGTRSTATRGRPSCSTGCSTSRPGRRTGSTCHGEREGAHSSYSSKQVHPVGFAFPVVRFWQARLFRCRHMDLDATQQKTYQFWLLLT